MPKIKDRIFSQLFSVLRIANNLNLMNGFNKMILVHLEVLSADQQFSSSTTGGC